MPESGVYHTGQLTPLADYSVSLSLSVSLLGCLCIHKQANSQDLW